VRARENQSANSNQIRTKHKTEMMPRRRKTTATGRALLLGAAVAAVVAFNSCAAFAFPPHHRQRHLTPARREAAAAAAMAPRRVGPAMMSTKDDVDSSAKAPSMPFASAPLQLEKGAAAAAASSSSSSPAQGPGRRKPDPEKPASYFDIEDETAATMPTQLEGDLLKDGGVFKTVVRPGTGQLVTPGAEVVVRYEGRTGGESGGVVLCRGEDFRFLQGDGTMIGGFETAVGSMRVGEVAKVTVQPWYAYGSTGVAPVVGPDTPLEFDIEVLEASGNFLNPRSFRDLDSKKLRDARSIAEDYAQRSELRMRNEENLSDMEKAQRWFKSLYFFGFFTGETGERPPWYLTPTITFPIMFAFCAVAFYILISSGGVTIKRDLEPLMGPEVLDFGLFL
jgi:FKBP-type peptidyl-prolyl cis-trans isomerase